MPALCFKQMYHSSQPDASQIQTFGGKTAGSLFVLSLFFVYIPFVPMTCVRISDEGNRTNRNVHYDHTDTHL